MNSLQLTHQIRVQQIGTPQTSTEVTDIRIKTFPVIMSIERAKQLIKQTENIRLEFKKATTALPNNLFETICAMLNRDGGDIILGVTDANVL